LKIAKGEPGGRLFVWIIAKVHKCLDEIGTVRRGIVDAAPTPYWTLREGLEVETGYDAEIAAAASESPVQVWVGLLVDLEDCASRGDELVVGDIVAGPAVRAGEEGDAAFIERLMSGIERSQRRELAYLPASTHPLRYQPLVLPLRPVDLLQG
jgi:hypothetical protein